MEAILNFVFAYPLSSLFLVFVAISSFSYLILNNKVFDSNYRWMMWVFVPISIFSLYSVLHCFNTNIYLYLPTGIFLSLAYISSGIKGLFPRTKKKGDVVQEVLVSYTPEFPVGDRWGAKMWHLKMDIFALLGLWIFIFLDHKILPLIWEGLSLSR